MIRYKTIEPGTPFSWRTRWRSFAHAGRGILLFFRTGHNAQLHLVAAVLVTFLSVYFKVSKTDAVLIIFSVGIVWVTEMLNTVAEKIMDFISEEYHPAIRNIKDIAAGAVLVASVTALLTGLFIFIPKIIQL